MRTSQIQSGEYWNPDRVLRKPLQYAIVLISAVLVTGCDSKDSVDTTDGKVRNPVLSQTSAESPLESVGQERGTKIQTLLSTYSGEALEDRLEQLGEEIAASGDIDACIEFWASLPPGEMSGRAFNSSMHRIVRSNPFVIFEKLDEIRSVLPDLHMRNALRVAATSFADRGDEVMALTMVRENSKFTVEEQIMFAGAAVLRVGSSRPAELGKLFELIPAGSGRDGIVLHHLSVTALDFIGLKKPAELQTIVESLGESAQDLFVDRLATHFGRSHPNEALVTLPHLLPQRLQMPYMVEAFRNWTAQDVNSALDWVSSYPDTTIRDELIAGSISNISIWNAEAGKKWAESISDIELRTQALQVAANVSTESGE